MKKKHNDLIVRANEVLLTMKEKVEIANEDNSINESYNGQTAGLGVTIAMSGLLPALAIYYQRSSGKSTCDKRQILNAIALMIKKPNSNEYFGENAEIPAKVLFEFAINKENGDKLDWLQREIIDCSIALKQVIRTFKQKKNEDNVK